MSKKQKKNTPSRAGLLKAKWSTVTQRSIKQRYRSALQERFALSPGHEEEQFKDIGLVKKLKKKKIAFFRAPHLLIKHIPAEL
uniref:Uncharacterized protein n=1 Tax=Seriola lalandi dorsalis TaxID=1841481 RepID=A0A3B4WNR3_SERLL